MGPIEPLAAALCLELAGERIIFLEEAAEGQLPDSPMERSSRLLQLGPCGMP